MPDKRPRQNTTIQLLRRPVIIIMAMVALWGACCVNRASAQETAYKFELGPALRIQRLSWRCQYRQSLCSSRVCRRSYIPLSCEPAMEYTRQLYCCHPQRQQFRHDKCIPRRGDLPILVDRMRPRRPCRLQFLQLRNRRDLPQDAALVAISHFGYGHVANLV